MKSTEVFEASVSGFETELVLPSLVNLRVLADSLRVFRCSRMSDFWLFECIRALALIHFGTNTLAYHLSDEGEQSAEDLRSAV